jgi:TolB-like protein
LIAPLRLRSLPFANLSTDLENDYFCDGLAEELLNALAKIEDLKVAARTSAFSFKNSNTNVSEIGRILNVEKVLMGGVRKSGNRIRITVQLVDATTGYSVWSERYDRELRDVFAVQDEITRAVVEQLKIKLFGDQAQPRPDGDDTEAYQLYLKDSFTFAGTRGQVGLGQFNSSSRRLKSRRNTPLLLAAWPVPDVPLLLLNCSTGNSSARLAGRDQPGPVPG